MGTKYLTKPTIFLWSVTQVLYSSYSPVFATLYFSKHLCLRRPKRHRHNNSGHGLHRTSNRQHLQDKNVAKRNLLMTSTEMLWTL